MSAANAVIAECRLRDREIQAQWCARRVGDLLESALGCAPAVSLAVSGGRTPVTFLRRLSELPLDWRKITIALVDERWVDSDAEDSNERLVREHLLRAEAAAASFIPLKNPADTPEKGVSAADAALKVIPWPLTVAVLGMGDDGHTASLFPNAQGLAEGLDAEQTARVVAVRPAGKTPPRMSMTLAALVRAHHVMLLLSGENKWHVYEKAMEDLRADAVPQMPVRAILARPDVPVEVYWAP